MGWRVRLLLIGLTSLMLALLFLTVLSLAAPNIERLAFLVLATLGANLFVGLIVLFKFGGNEHY